jgi:hypothetical protein
MDALKDSLRRREKLIPMVVFLGIATWRVLGQNPSWLWRDWLLILAFYGTYTVVARASRAWPVITASVMAFLLGIYIHGQLPYTLSAFGLAK